MSLNRRQIAATRKELAANLALSGLTTAEISSALSWDTHKVEAAADISKASPQDVWLLRDYLNLKIKNHGGTPLPYSTLTDQSRLMAQRWFELTDIESL